MDTDSQHRALVRRLKKPAEAIDKALTPDGIDLTHAAMGIAGESGEVVDLIKKAVVNGHELDNEKVKEEVGDLLFYLQMVGMTCGFTLERAMLDNMAKLTHRYPDGYSDLASTMRRDVDD